MSSYLDGNRVYCDSFGEWIEYRTRSEALVASLVLHFNFPLKMLEPIFELQCCGSDYRAAECSFTRPTDVYSRMRTLRTKSARGRPGTTDAAADKAFGIVAGFSNHDIYNGVIDSLVEERRMVVHESYFPSYLSDERARTAGVHERDAGKVSDTLESMSLVHRTWTIPAQQALRRCAIVKYKYARRHPLITTLTSPCLAFADTFVWKTDGLLTEDEMILLKGLITYPYQRTLQNLHLEVVFLESEDGTSHSKELDDPSSMSSPLDCIGTLASLKKLSLRLEILHTGTVNADERNKIINSVCYVITHIHCLEYLRIYEEADDATDYEVSPQLAHVHPPPSLKSLCLYLEHPQPRILSWLTMPNAGYQLDHLTLFPSDRGFDPKLSEIRSAVPFLKSLSINVLDHLIAEETDEESENMVVEAMREALSLETLTLRFYIDYRPTNFKIIVISSLPSALQQLSLLFHIRVSAGEVVECTYIAKLDEAISRFALTVNHKGRLRIIIDNRRWYVRFI